MIIGIGVYKPYDFLFSKVLFCNTMYIIILSI